MALFLYAKQCCECKDSGTLPDEVKITFSDITRGDARIENLVTFATKSCFGSGATGRATAPGGADNTGLNGGDKGPLSAVEVTSAGSGYAIKARSEPEIKVTPPVDGSGGKFHVTLSRDEDDCKIPRWTVASVTLDGGDGYKTGSLTLSPSLPSTVVVWPAQVTLSATRLPRAAPTITAVAAAYRPPNSTDAKFTVNLEEHEDGTGKWWSVSSVTIDDGGTGYPATGQIYFLKASGDTAAYDACRQFRCGSRAPTVTVEAGGSGTGAVLEAVVSQDWDDSYYISDITITTAGSGYAVDDPLTITVETDTGTEERSGYIWSVDEDGAILGASPNPPAFVDPISFGIITSIEACSWYVASDGEYYGPEGGEVPPYTIEVVDGGAYYDDSDSEPPYVADVSVTLSQTPPSFGSGAELSATIDDDPESPTFGKVTAFNIDNAGTDYLAWTYAPCPSTAWNGQSFDIPRLDCACCMYEGCVNAYGVDGGNVPGASLSLAWSGENSAPEVRLSAACDITFRADPAYAPFDCASPSFTATSKHGGKAVVTTGTPKPSCDEVFSSPSLIVKTSADGNYIFKRTIKARQYNTVYDFQFNGGIRRERFLWWFFWAYVKVDEFIGDREVVRTSGSSGGNWEYHTDCMDKMVYGGNSPGPQTRVYMARGALQLLGCWSLLYSATGSAPFYEDWHNVGTYAPTPPPFPAEFADYSCEQGAQRRWNVDGGINSSGCSCDLASLKRQVPLRSTVHLGFSSTASSLGYSPLSATPEQLLAARGVYSWQWSVEIISDQIDESGDLDQLLKIEVEMPD